MNLTKTLLGAALAIGSLAASAGVAGAEHAHFVAREDRNGETQCRYIAHGQTEKSPEDPGGHKFHENVHAGQPGSDENGTDMDKSDNEGRCDNVEDRNSKSRRP